jgi:hypothetical protein
MSWLAEEGEAAASDVDIEVKKDRQVGERTSVVRGNESIY